VNDVSDGTFWINNVPAVDILITVSSPDSVDYQPLHFGYDTNATYCIDFNLGEIGLPPTPPLGNFDARFRDLRDSEVDCRDGGLRKDFRAWMSASVVDTFWLAIQKGESTGPYYGLSWPADLNASYNSCVLQDKEFGGLLSQSHIWEVPS
jgi:hypothetical protein